MGSMSFSPFILPSTQLCHGDGWQPLKDSHTGDIHPAIFSVALALKYLHKNKRCYGGVSMDSIFVFSRNGNPIYKLVEKEAKEGSIGNEVVDWKSLGEFMEDIQQKANLSIKDKFYIELVKHLRKLTDNDTGFMKAIPDYIQHWYNAEVISNTIFDCCFHCCCRGRGKLSDKDKSKEWCKDKCLGYYCDDCLKGSKIAQFCPHHGPQTKGMNEFWCSSSKRCDKTLDDWFKNSAECNGGLSDFQSTESEQLAKCNGDGSLKIATWNVTSLENECDLIWILTEMEDLKLDVMGISETKWQDPGESFGYELNDKEYYIIYSRDGPCSTDPKGVAWIISKRFYKSILCCNCPEYNRIISITLALKDQTEVILTQIYSPTANTQNNNEGTQDNFYKKLREHAGSTHIVAGDFNEKIWFDNYCWISSERHLSHFCSEKGLVISNLWPCKEEPLTKAQNDFILMKRKYWKENCTSSCKKFVTSYHSDHLFPVVTELKLNIKESLKRNYSVKDGKPIIFFMDDDEKQEVQDWIRCEKAKLGTLMNGLRLFVKDLFATKIVVLNAKYLLRHPAADSANDFMVTSVCGHLVELSFSKEIGLTKNDQIQLSSVLRFQKDKGEMKDLVQLLKDYRTAVFDATRKTRQKFSPREPN